MKKPGFILVCFLLLFAMCTTKKAVVNNNDSLSGYKPPLTVFSIGNWNKEQHIVTVTDARNQYYIIKTPQNDSLKIGQVYRP